MVRIRLKELIKIKKRPNSCISLPLAIKNPIETVKTYVFTDSIRSNIAEILESAASGNGRGYWIVAEYGAGKTHLESTVKCVLTSTDEKIWNEVQDNEIRTYKSRLQNNRLFPVVFSLKGEGGVEISEDNLFMVIEKEIERSLEESNERDKIKITSDDEILHWYKESSNLRESINEYIKHKVGTSVNELDNSTISDLIRNYCDDNKIKLQVSTSIKERIKYIYDQLKKLGYTGMLFIIDEFATWQRRHPRGTPGYYQDEDVLETLSWVLPKDYKLNIYIIIASAEPAPAKLKGDRFKEFSLFSGPSIKEFDFIVSQRVRELNKEKMPEIDQYYEHYRKEFESLKGIDKQYFYDIFPFHPKCFEVVRKITRKPQFETYSTRAAIFYIYEILTNEDILSRDSLIKTSDLLDSHFLVDDLKHVYVQAYTSYQAALDGVKGMDIEINEKKMSEDIIKTLFLWHVASSEPTPLSIRDITDMTLVSSDIVKGEDMVKNILLRLNKDVPQIRYTKDKGASFNITDIVTTKISTIISNFKRKMTDPFKIHENWENSLILSPLETGGRKGIFSDLEYDKNISRNVEFRKIEYPAEVILAKNWNKEYGEKFKDDLHMRIVILTKHIEFDLTELNDSRIAVCISSELTDAARDEARNYMAIIGAEEEYKNKSGQEAEDIRSDINTRKREVINNLLNKQIGIFKAGRIYTKQSLSIDEKKVFSSDALENIIEELASPILGSAYTSQPFDLAKGKKFSGKDAKKIFEGFLAQSPKQNAINACQNFGEGLGLSRFEEPKKFNPVETNKVFEKFKDNLKQNGEIDIPKIYQELQSPPYGLLNELVTLYILCFVRANSNVEIRLKPHNRFNKKKLTSLEIPNVDWKGNIDKDLEVLEYTSAPTWDGILPCARVIIPDLKATSNPDEIKEQEMILIGSLKTINEKIPQMKIDLEHLYSRFEEKFETKFNILNNFNAISNVQTFYEFYNEVSNLYSRGDNPNIDLDALIGDFKIFNSLMILSENSTMLLHLKSYLDDSVIADGELYNKKSSLQIKAKLSSFIDNLKLIDEIKSQFQEFKNEYSNKYQIHHRKYHEEISDLHRNLGYVKDKIEVISRLGKLGIILQTTRFGIKYQELNKKMKVCTNETIVNVDSTPLCQKCKITLEFVTPTNEVEEFIRNVEYNFRSGVSQLSQILVHIKDVDKDERLNVLEKVIREKDAVKLVGILTDDLVKYLLEQFDKNNVQFVQTDVLKKFVQEHSFVEEKDLEKFLDALRKELNIEIEKAKKDNPGKKIRIVL